MSELVKVVPGDIVAKIKSVKSSLKAFTNGNTLEVEGRGEKGPFWIGDGYQLVEVQPVNNVFFKVNVTKLGPDIPGIRSLDFISPSVETAVKEGSRRLEINDGNTSVIVFERT